MSCLAVEVLAYARPSSSSSYSERRREPSSDVATTAVLDQTQIRRQVELAIRFEEVWSECSVENWDGQGAHPLRQDALDRFFCLARLLPPELPLPEIGATPSGSISVDWENGSDWLLSLILSAGDQISFAAYYKGARTHGSFPFFPERLPEEIGLAFQRWLAGPGRS